VRGPRREVFRKAGKGVDVSPQVLGDFDAAVAPSTLQGELQGAEQARGSRDPGRDEAKLAQVAFVDAPTDALTGGKVGQCLAQGLLAVLRQFQGLAQRIHHPPQDRLAGGPAAVALRELLEGHGLLAIGGHRRGSQDFVDGV
jgi:hypothetical protein